MDSASVRGRVTALWERLGPRTRDLAFMAMTLLVAAAETLARRDEGPGSVALGATFGAVSVLALWWRRRAPAAVTVVGAAVYAVTYVPLALGIGLFSLAVRRRDRWLALATVAATALFTVVSADTRAGTWPSHVALGLIEAGFCVATGAYIGVRRDLVVSLRERAERAEGERELRAEQARLGERSRIAREMHDVLAHEVSLIALHAGALEVNAFVEAAQVEQTAALIRTTARHALEELR